ncbi:tetratricopeptide repeat protein [Stutzerimonas azotifigens]|uniref:tetratricopeptide repeat protein n=1 Tax=Stutzerimonas azotifigens TaxID=291995 RepID=UPI000402489D|nr:tetratricopeptide repeat protein [Stutzerimonas azotifigens]
MEHWKDMIAAGNRHFQLGDWVEARELYLQALALALTLFERWPDADEAVAALVVSHHNLADLHLRLGQPEESAEYLCACHERLLRSMADPHLGEGLRQAALRHSRETYVALLSFTTEQGFSPRCDALLAKPARDRLADARAKPRDYH